MPPVHKSHTVNGVQDNHRGPLVRLLLPPEQGRVLEDQADTVVPHVSADVDGEQSERHAHHDRSEDKVESGDLKYITVRVRVPVHVFILTGQAQHFGMPVFIMPLFYKFKVELPQRLRTSS